MLWTSLSLSACTNRFRQLSERLIMFFFCPSSFRQLRRTRAPSLYVILKSIHLCLPFLITSRRVATIPPSSISQHAFPVRVLLTFNIHHIPIFTFHHIPSLQRATCTLFVWYGCNGLPACFVGWYIWKYAVVCSPNSDIHQNFNSNYCSG